MDYAQYDPIDFMGMTITEPTVVATNVLITVFGLYWASQLKRLRSPKVSVTYWQFFFLLTALAMLFGAIGHATRAYEATVGTVFFKIAWVLGALGVSCIELSAIELVRQPRLKSLLRAFVGLHFGLFVGVLFVQHSFMWVNINSALGTLGVFGAIHLIHYLRHHYPPSRWVLIGILVMPAILVVKGFEWRISMFNHHDLAHFILLLSMYFFFRAAIATHEQATPSQVPA